MPRVIAILIAGAGLLVLMAHAVWQQGPRIEADLATRAESALGAAGFTNIQIEPDGQELTLRGSLGADTQRQNALGIVQALEGVTQVHDELQVLAIAQPPVAIESAEPQPSEQRPVQVSEQVAVPEQTQDQPVSAGVPDLGSEQQPLVAPPIPASAQESATELAGLSTADACQRRLTSLVASESIRFGFGQTDIDPASFPLLQKLAHALVFCPYAIEVGGHTDSTGEDKVNQWYSEQRAMAVRDYLVNAVSVSRTTRPADPQTPTQPVGDTQDDRLQPIITARGYGASRPRATNETRNGRRINRRIEFTVSEIGS